MLDAAGCDVVLVETVGSARPRPRWPAWPSTTLVALAPGFGDAVQVAKAGILEVADVVVNKADRRRRGGRPRPAPDAPLARPGPGRCRWS